MIDLRRVDELVAEKVMGWHKHQNAWFGDDNHYRCDFADFRPSSKIEAAWEIVDQFDEFNIDRFKNDVRGGHTYAAFVQSELDSCYADTAAIAICLAALKWKGVEVPA
jgi:hypothetical protein